MAGGGYRGILAAVPTAQNLHSASRGGVYRKIKIKGELTLGLMSGEDQKRTPTPCRSQLAGEKRPGTAFIQAPRVIVDVHRQQAGSYNGNAYVFGMHTINCRSRLAGDRGGSVHTCIA
jgi:hypothetical protein